MTRQHGWGHSLDQLQRLGSTGRGRLVLVLALACIAGVLLLPRSSLYPAQACLPARTDWPAYLPGRERKVYSQNGEDGLIEGIFDAIGTTNRYYVEFGTESGTECNTRLLREEGWSGLLMDGGFENPAIGLHKEFITPGNINQLFEKYNVPDEFDLLSIDVNFDDWWVWKSISPRYRPRLLIIEYNAAIPVEESRVIDPEDQLRWPTHVGTTNYWGASLRALRDLGRLKGYTLVACDNQGVNAFFVRQDILECQTVEPPPLEHIYVHNPFPHYVPETNASRLWQILDGRGEVVRRVSGPQLSIEERERRPAAS